MSTRATIFLTNGNLHWHHELCARYNYGIESPDDCAVVLEFGPECLLEDYGIEGFVVAIPSDSPLAKIITKAHPHLSAAQEEVDSMLAAREGE